MSVPRREAGLRIIFGYKLGKAALWLLLAAALGLLVASGRVEAFRELAHGLKAHVASRWSLLAAAALESALSARGLRFIEVGLVLDGLLSLVEGWALWRGHRWGPWLVVVATALPVPVEAWELVRHASPWRALLLAVNLAVVAYLLRWLRRHPGP